MRYLQSVQSFAAFELLDLLLALPLVSLQWQSVGCFLVDCLLVDVVFAILNSPFKASAF